MQRLIVSLVLACLSTPGSQPSAGDESWPMRVAVDAFRKGQAGYVAAVLDLLDREAEARTSPIVVDVWQDALATHMVLVGEQHRATEIGDAAYGRPAAAAPPGDPLAAYKPVSAVEAIVAAAKDRRLVMINEEHRSSEQRAFANQLLEPLRAAGFDYLALEALSEDDQALRSRGYPTLASGLYVSDPAYGDLVRRALELGFKVIGYEASPEHRNPRPSDRSPMIATNRRERAQAANIHRRILDADPNARVLVYAGRDHIAERPGGDWRPMGAVLKGMSGIDPLTVNLFGMTERSDLNYEHWAFRLAQERGWTDQGPVLLADGKGGFWSASPGALDAYVIHPRSVLREGRPSWMAMGGLRRPVSFAAPAFDEPVLLQAHLASEPAEAIPVDQVILWPGKLAPALFLRKGDYRVRAIDRTGRERLGSTVTVK